MKHWRFTLLMAALGALGPFSVDTYFPSFPSIATHFGVGLLEVQSTLTLYLVALGGTGLFHGSLSDAYGRRPVILVSLVVYVIAAFACPLAPRFGHLLLLRVVQGMAAGAGMIVGRAIIRDRFGGAEAQRFMAQVTVVWGLAPAVAPILGGWLHEWFGWRGPFVFLGMMGTGLVLVCWRWLPESLPREARQSFHPAPLLRGYWQVALDPRFIALSLAMALGGAGFLLYVATAPDFVLNILRLSPTQFGWLFVPTVSGLVLGSVLMTRLAGQIPPLRLVGWGYGLMAAAAAVNVGYNLLFEPRIPWAVAPLTFYTLGFALFAPVATILCLDLFPARRGLASSLQGFVHLILFALVSSVLAVVLAGSGRRHAVAMAAMVALNWCCWRLFRRAHAPPPTAAEPLKEPPRVAPATQPWALRHNPFGIELRGRR